jgi:hypothetical protein
MALNTRLELFRIHILFGRCWFAGYTYRMIFFKPLVSRCRQTGFHFTLWSEPKLGANAAENSSFRGGEEILKYDGVTLNAGRGLNPATGIFLAPQV